jgi:hypothetical protein
MESTASMNSRPTQQMESKNRVMADAWNSKKHSVTADPYIAGHKRVKLHLEIIKEY